MNETVKKPSQKQDSSIIQLVCFKLGDEEYALDIMNVQEVIHLVDIMEVPQMPNFVHGVINVRGDVMPVFDLRVKFNLTVNEFTNKARIIVVMLGGEKISFIVDEILETLRIDANSIDPAPAVKMKIKRECIKGIGELVDRMIILLDIEEIHRDIKENIASYGDSWKKEKTA